MVRPLDRPASTSNYRMRQWLCRKHRCRRDDGRRKVKNLFGKQGVHKQTAPHRDIMHPTFWARSAAADD
jgi:hypothetical protein